MAWDERLAERIVMGDPIAGPYRENAIVRAVADTARQGRWTRTEMLERMVDELVRHSDALSEQCKRLMENTVSPIIVYNRGD